MFFKYKEELKESKCRDYILRYLYNITDCGIKPHKIELNEIINAIICDNNYENKIIDFVNQKITMNIIKLSEKTIHFLLDNNYILNDAISKSNNENIYRYESTDNHEKYNITLYGKNFIEKQQSFKKEIIEKITKRQKNLKFCFNVIFLIILTYCTIYFPIQYDKHKNDEIKNKIIKIENKIDFLERINKKIVLNDKIDSMFLYKTNKILK